MLLALGAAVLAGAAIFWAPLPRRWFDAPAAEAPAPPQRPLAGATPPTGVSASAATAYVQFAVAAGPAGGGSATAPAKPGPPVLVGLSQARGRRVAYVLADGQTTRAAVGEWIGPWRVVAIGAHAATLRDGGKTMTLALYGPRAAPPAPALAAAVSPAPSAIAAAPTAAAVPPPTPVTPRLRALEPASAPRRSQAGPRYWVGPADKAPPGYIVLKPGEPPPQ
ncbi:MAG TPA: hypothetical protein VMT68_19355 [Caulobacteraceae bacterium]|nr:hypothetical protein [Caulobacteraceae bacterium]